MTVALFDNLFLSVGAMKAGTTWLSAMLRRHPELHFTPEKEIHYFYHAYVDRNSLSDTRRLREAKRRYLVRFDPETANPEMVRRDLSWVRAYLDNPVDDYWYRNLFQMRGKELYACDFSNLNAHLPADVWPHIAAKCNTLKVLYTMRDPVKRLWSHAKFHAQFSGELDKMQSWGPGDFKKFLRRPHIWNNAEYGVVLRNLKAALPADSLKVIFYEDIHADQAGALKQIEDFLGVANHTYPPALLAKRFTESVKLDMPDFFTGLVAKDVARIRQEVEAEGFVIPSSWD